MPYTWNPSCGESMPGSREPRWCLLTLSRLGAFTGAVALALLLVAVLWGGSASKELVPWLPLFIAFLSLTTVAVHKVSHHPEARPLIDSVEHGFPGLSIDTWDDGSSRTGSDPEVPQPPTESNRQDSLYFALCGPPSRCSQRTGTDLSLSSVVGQCRSHWDAQTRSHFPAAGPLEQNTPGDFHAGSCHAHEDSPCSGSERGTVESSHPLLGL